MTGIIPQDIVEQVRQASDIVDIINQYLRLRKRGRNFLALCPFHMEKTASFSVSQDKQIFHCFGCGKGGNVFTFLMEHENMSFGEAVRHLASRAGIKIPERKVDDKSKEQFERLHYAQQVALEYFKKTLYSDRYKDKILGYLHDKRRLSDESICLFHFGLAGEEWDGLLNYALKKDLFPKDLVEAGLVIHSDRKDKHFDRFRQRLMIPIFNLSEKPIAFGGRALKKGEEAKYINSPETKLYSKGNVLYGLNFTRQYIREQNEVIIVEGYFDLISLYQAGIKNVVASSGTAFTSQQARLLARFAEKAYLFFDADSAGQQAAVRSVDALYDAGIDIRVMVPPDSEDPDSTAQKYGPERIMELRKSAFKYFDFRYHDAKAREQGSINEEKLIKEVAELLKRIGDKTRRELLISEAAESLMVNPLNIWRLIPDTNSRASKKIDSEPTKKIADIGQDLIALLLHHPEYIETVREKLHFDDFNSEALGKIYSLILTIYKTHGTISESTLIEMADNKMLSELISSLAKIPIPEQQRSKFIDDYVNTLLKFKLDQRIKDLKSELKTIEKQGNPEKASELAAEIEELIAKRGE